MPLRPHRRLLDLSSPLSLLFSLPPSPVLSRDSLLDLDFRRRFILPFERDEPLETESEPESVSDSDDPEELPLSLSEPVELESLDEWLPLHKRGKVTKETMNNASMFSSRMQRTV